MNWKSQPFTAKHEFLYSIITEDGYLVGTTTSMSLADEVVTKLQERGVYTLADLRQNEECKRALFMAGLTSWRENIQTIRKGVL